MSVLLLLFISSFPSFPSSLHFPRLVKSPIVVYGSLASNRLILSLKSHWTHSTKEESNDGGMGVTDGALGGGGGELFLSPVRFSEK